MSVLVQILTTVAPSAIIASVITFLGNRIEKRRELRASQAGTFIDELRAKYAPVRRDVGRMIGTAQDAIAESVYAVNRNKKSSPGSSNNDDEFDAALRRMQTFAPGGDDAAADLIISGAPLKLREAIGQTFARFVGVQLDVLLFLGTRDEERETQKERVEASRDKFMDSVAELDNQWQAVQDYYYSLRSGDDPKTRSRDGIFARLREFSRRNLPQIGKE